MLRVAIVTRTSPGLHFLLDGRTAIGVINVNDRLRVFVQRIGGGDCAVVPGTESRAGVRAVTYYLGHRDEIDRYLENQRRNLTRRGAPRETPTCVPDVKHLHDNHLRSQTRSCRRAAAGRGATGELHVVNPGFQERLGNATAAAPVTQQPYGGLRTSARRRYRPAAIEASHRQRRYRVSHDRRAQRGSPCFRAKSSKRPQLDGRLTEVTADCWCWRGRRDRTW